MYGSVAIGNACVVKDIICVIRSVTELSRRFGHNMENTIANIRILDVVRLVHEYFIFVILIINMLS
jgi:hypothetical protein